MNYTHLTQSERYQIQALKACSLSLRRIAAQLGRSASTIAREIKRAPAAQSYQADAAHSLAIERQAKCRNARAIAPERWTAVHSYLRLYMSPEQICGRLAVEGAACGSAQSVSVALRSTACISHESIYQHIYRNKAQGGDLASYLRCQKVRRKRYASGHERRGQLKGRICIEQRRLPLSLGSVSATGRAIPSLDGVIRAYW